MERNLSPRRRAYDLAMRALVWLSALLTCALLVFLIGYIFYRGAGSVTLGLPLRHKQLHQGHHRHPAEHP